MPSKHETDTARPGQERLAVVLFNLGGPDNLEAVRPFLFNLFNDPAIISLPTIARTPLAYLISSRRAPVAREIYEQMDGRSPIVPLTEEQADGLKADLDRRGTFEEVGVFIAMRYWHPRAEETAKRVKAFNPDRIVLLPLYPQFSTTTSASSLREWRRFATKVGITAPTHTVCCYPSEDLFIDAHCALIREALEKAGGERIRILFSAHGLPKRTVVQKGDPYQWQVEQTSAAVVERLGIPDLDWQICYQSRVGPLEWIGPSTDDEIRRAGADGVGIAVVPIAFVSEHSETLVELDIEYGHLAEEAGVPLYIRVPALGSHPAFLESLGSVVMDAVTWTGIGCTGGKRVCPKNFHGCPCTVGTPERTVGKERTVR